MTFSTVSFHVAETFCLEEEVKSVVSELFALANSDENATLTEFEVNVADDVSGDDEKRLSNQVTECVSQDRNQLTIHYSSDYTSDAVGNFLQIHFATFMKDKFAIEVNSYGEGEDAGANILFPDGTWMSVTEFVSIHLNT